MNQVEVLKVWGLNELERIQALPNTLKCEILHRDKDDYVVLLISDKFTKTPAQMVREAGW
jgi:hypothetical protein